MESRSMPGTVVGPQRVGDRTLVQNRQHLITSVDTRDRTSDIFQTNDPGSSPPEEDLFSEEVSSSQPQTPLPEIE